MMTVIVTLCLLSMTYWFSRWTSRNMGPDNPAVPRPNKARAHAKDRSIRTAYLIRWGRRGFAPNMLVQGLVDKSAPSSPELLVACSKRSFNEKEVSSL